MSMSYVSVKRHLSTPQVTVKLQCECATFLSNFSAHVLRLCQPSDEHVPLFLLNFSEQVSSFLLDLQWIPLDEHSLISVRLHWACRMSQSNVSEHVPDFLLNFNEHVLRFCLWNFGDSHVSVKLQLTFPTFLSHLTDYTTPHFCQSSESLSPVFIPYEQWVQPLLLSHLSEYTLYFCLT